MSTTNIAIFASGSGTNAENIIKFFKKDPEINISLLISNKEDSTALIRAKKHKVPTKTITNNQWQDSTFVLDLFNKYNINFIVLAGFLILVPPYLVNKYHKRIINIHPALLPEYGGKGMYGDKVHKTVIREGKKESGITIHYVNEKYDEGNILFQVKCNIPKYRSTRALANKIHELEYKYYPKVIDCIVKKKIK